MTLLNIRAIYMKPFKYSKLQTVQTSSSASHLEISPTSSVNKTLFVKVNESKTSFFSELIKNPKSIGAICASSPYLARRIAASIDAQQEGYVVELGAGTGAITRALLLCGVPASKLIVVEQSHQFAQHLKNCFPLVQVIQGDAADIGLMLEEMGAVANIVSGLPLRSLPKDMVSNITAACVRVLPYSGRLVQFTYAPGETSPWAKAGLEKINSQLIWRNFPPAWIESFAPPRLQTHP